MTALAHVDAGRSETAAAKRASRFAETLEGRVLAAVVAAGEQGLTAKEAREKLGIPVERHYSVAPRLSALKAKKLVDPTDVVRDNFQAYVATPTGRGETTPHERFEAEMNSGQPIVDNASDRLWGPNGQPDDQPERPDGECGFCGGVGTVDDGDRLCQICRGAGGWQQHDGLIVECPRGCMTGGAA